MMKLFFMINILHGLMLNQINLGLNLNQLMIGLGFLVVKNASFFFVQEHIQNSSSNLFRICLCIKQLTK